MLETKDQMSLVSFLLAIIKGDGIFSHSEQHTFERICQKYNISKAKALRGSDMNIGEAVEHISSLPEEKKEIIVQELLDMVETSIWDRRIVDIYDNKKDNTEDIFLALTEAAGLTDAMNKYFDIVMSRKHNERIAENTKDPKQLDAESQYELAMSYAKGNNVEQDIKKAVYWFSKAASQGHAKSQFNLGILYSKGQGVSEDYSKAFLWWSKAADQGFCEAQFLLGVLFFQGKGTEKNHTKAIYWLKKAAEQGHSEAISYLESLI